MIVWDAVTHPRTLAREIWEWDGERYRAGTYGDLLSDARRAAAALRRRGVVSGEVVGGVLTNGPETTRAAIGVMFTGATFASLPIIARGMSLASYSRQLAGMCKHLGAGVLLAEERLLRAMPAGLDLGVEVVSYASLLESTAMADITPPELDEVLFIQFSSGTTGKPRGAQLTGSAIEAQLIRLADSLEIDSERDIGCMWLPLSHDMGIFGGAFLAWYMGIRAVKSTPERFLQAPRSWFDDCAQFGATITAGPPSALAMASRAEAARSSGEPLRLRLCLVGAEMVDWPVLERAAEVFAPRGLELSTFTTAYGLAEATLAVTVGELDRPPVFVDVDADALTLGATHLVDPGDPRLRRLVSTGTPLKDTEVSIDRYTGEIVIRSRSLACGYFDNAEETRAHFSDGAFRTSDLGFLHDGHLYVSGRSDDLLILHGRNIFVNELEARIGAVPGIRDGNCAFVQQPGNGRHRVSLVAEADESVDIAKLASQLCRLTMEEEGVPVHECVFVPKGSFPMTPSGKVQRHRCLQLVRQPQLGIRVLT
jgi:acyl-CoA synthetase (AMP-forming)/AMP-acid ligase II